MTTKPKVLLVDDERAITANLAPFLERAGFSVNSLLTGRKHWPGWTRSHRT